MFSDDKIGIIQLKAAEATRSGLIEEATKASVHLPSYYAGEILERLLLVAASEEERSALQAMLTGIMRKARWQKLFPWLAALAAALLCIAMYWFGRK